MFKIYILFLFNLLINLNIPNLFAEKNEVKINSNSIKKLNWEPAIPLKEGLLRTIEWFKNNL